MLLLLLQVPKSIDNDVMLVDKTFGFDTVVQEVVTRPLLAAKTEAASARKGVGLVKVRRGCAGADGHAFDCVCLCLWGCVWGVSSAGAVVLMRHRQRRPHDLNVWFVPATGAAHSATAYAVAGTSMPMQ